MSVQVVRCQTTPGAREAGKVSKMDQMGVLVKTDRGRSSSAERHDIIITSYPDGIASIIC